MTLSVIYLVVVSFVGLTSSQPTHDVSNQVSECGCQLELKVLRSQLNWLNEKVDGIISNRNTNPISTSTTPSSYGSECPCNFTRISEVNGCYSFLYNPLVWSAAADACVSLHGNAHLVAIDNAEEQSAVVNQWKTHTERGACGSLGFWTAGHRVDPSRLTSFVWKLTPSENIPLNYTNWRHGEPNNYRGTATSVTEACLHAQAEYNYAWNDARCTRTMCYVCEYDL